MVPVTNGLVRDVRHFSTSELAAAFASGFESGAGWFGGDDVLVFLEDDSNRCMADLTASYASDEQRALVREIQERIRRARIGG